MFKKVFIIAVSDEVNTQTEILGCDIIFSGVGKINATLAAYSAFSQGYSEVINIGSCGSLNLPVGNIIKVGQVFQDIDVTPLCPYGETPFETMSKQVVIDVKSPITCFTTDYFYDEKQIKKYSENYLEMIKKCSIFDMECYALAKACHRFNLKFQSYKWVSDSGDGSDWKENCRIGFKKTLKILSDEFKKERI